MNGKRILHKTLGRGVVTGIEDGRITVRFGDVEKKFSFPNAFSGFLSTDDPELNGLVEEARSAAAEQARLKEEAERAKRLAEEEERRQQAARAAAQKYPARRPKVRTTDGFEAAERHAQTGLESIAFKCNFCDGGSSGSCIGFRGKCSDQLISYNIEKAKHVWCSTGSVCKRYLDGEVTRAEFEAYREFDGSNSACYESRFLNNWEMSAGVYRHGEKAGMPMHIKRIHKGSLAFMTTRKPGDPESARFIFAIFLVDESYEGDERDEGSVTADSVWRIEMKPGEAERLLFWDYYVNANKPGKITFGSGLHRYLTDIEAAQILRDAAAIKKDAFSREFYLHFCRANGIDPDGLRQPTGTLKRAGTV